MKKTRFLTENIKVRIKLLKEENNRMRRDVKNGVKISFKEFNDYKQNYAYCLNLLKQCKYDYYNHKITKGEKDG